MVIPNCHLLDFGWCCADQTITAYGSTTAGRRRDSPGPGRSIVKRYASNPLVVAMDVKNEPRPATVGGKAS